MTDVVEQREEKRVSWAELFVDLVFVFAVTEVSTLLRHDHGWAGVGRAAVVFVPLYWVWVGLSIHANTHDVENPLDRIGMFAAALCSLFMALAVPGTYDGHRYGDRGLLYAVSYLAARVILVGLVLRGQQMEPRAFMITAFLTGPLLVVGGFLHGTARELVWAAGALIALATPKLARQRMFRVRFDPAHLPERFGLLLIIALGESIVATGATAVGATRLTAGGVAAVAAAFTLACGLWWVYFVYAASAVRHAMGFEDVRIDLVRQVLSYAHLVFISGIIAVAAALGEVVAHPDRRLGGGEAGLLFGGCALYLATFGYTRWRMFGVVATTRLGAAAVVLVLLPVAGRGSGLAALWLLTAVLIALNAVEYALVAWRQRI
ncbi:MAG: low temperature requirement protein A [Mycobacteriales bacterium]